MSEAGRRDGSIEADIAARVRRLRAARHLTLDALAAASGISRAMLSRIERGESSPTVGLLAKLCGSLGVALAGLVGDEPACPDGPLARRSDQPHWRDPASGYLRRAVSPAGTGSGVEIAEVELPADASALFDALGRAGGDRHVWVLDGALDVVEGGRVIALGSGDCLRVAIDGPVGLRNPGPASARCAVVAGRGGEGGRA